MTTDARPHSCYRKSTWLHRNRVRVLTNVVSIISININNVTATRARVTPALASHMTAQPHPPASLVT